MTLNKLIRKIIKSRPEDELVICNGHPEDELVVCTSQEYYNSKTEIKYDEVVDVVKENGKLIILTR